MEPKVNKEMDVYIHFGRIQTYDDHDTCEICHTKEPTRLERFLAATGIEQNKKNAITSTRYSPVTFLPMSIINQFRRPSNIYFTLILILSFTKYSSSSPAFTFIPIFVVFSISILKDFYEFI
ncbi:hypothetical protein MHBO_005234, partial [Bonamia ostreae]